MRVQTRIFFLLLCICMLIAVSACDSTKDEEGSSESTVHLVAPLNSYIEDFDTNQYKRWLEEQTGLKLEITWLPADAAEQIVQQQLQTGQGLPDAYIGFGSLEIFKNPNIQQYGEQGIILSLNELIEKYGDNTKGLFAELPEYNIRTLMTSADGNIYFMPGFSVSTITRYRQMMWVNKGWLDALDIEVPNTTEEFRDMLLAFKTGDPNGNGIADEVPMAGTEDFYSKQPYDFLINAFIYNDINNSRLLLENSNVDFAPRKDEWRDALIYIHGLYDEGLYSPLSFTQDDQQMKQIANDTNDILGVLLSPGITFTVLQNSPEVMERYIGIGPLEGPDGVRQATVWTPMPKANGVITSACKDQEAVFRLFDLMLSEEACLMGRYGEQGMDWVFEDSDDVSIYGTPATIRIINQLWNTTQNKHLCQIVPYCSRPNYSGGVTWDGNTTDGEYMNAQAALLNQDYAPKDYVGALIYTPEEGAEIQSIRTDIEAHVKKSAIAFITGACDIHDDDEWERYLSAFDDLQLSAFLETAQKAYDRMK